MTFIASQRAVVYALAFTLLGMIIGLPSSASAQTSTVRLSVCPTCTSEGVEGLILKQTNIAQLVGLNLAVLFISPPIMGEGIASKSLDVEWVGDQPTLSQLAHGIPVKIIGYQFDFELRLEALPAITSISDLKGKKVGTPFGTTAYELAASTVTTAGLPISTLINTAPTDLGTALGGGQVAAVSIWDPLWGVIEAKQRTHPLAKAFHTGFVLARTDFMNSNRDAVVRYLEAQMLAIAFRASHHAEADKRYEAAFGIPVEAARAAEEIDRDYHWTDPAKVNLDLIPRDYQDLANTEKFALKANLLPESVDYKGAIDTSLLKEALARIKTSKISVSQIKYISDAK